MSQSPDSKPDAQSPQGGRAAVEASAYASQGVLLQPPPMWSRILIWTLGMGTMVLLVWSWVTRIEETVSMDGAIETASPEAKVTSANDGLIEAVLIRPDQVVRRGDPLFRLSTQDLDVTIAGLRAKLVELEQQREVERSLFDARIGQLEIQAKLHQTVLERLTQLASTGAAQEVQVIERRSTLQETINAMEVERKELAKSDNILIIQQLEAKNAIN
jgi:hypothetical protein